VKRLVYIVRSRPSYMVGFLLLCLFTFLAIFGSTLYPHGTPINSGQIYEAPSWHHPFGTDFAGRDVLAMVVLGTRDVLVVAVIAGFITLAAGTLVGLLAAYLGGVVDTILMRLTDFVLSLPTYPILIVLAAVFRPSGALAMAILLSLTAWAGLARAIRAQILSVKKADYVEAARSLELGHWRIMVGEMLPSIMPYVTMHLIIAVTGAVYGEVGLYFLGIVPVQSTNWGVMLNWAFNVSGAIYTPQSVFFVIAPLIAITLLQMGAVLFNQALEEYYNPALQAVV
jgi:peptide/nickel transport system permease protein